MNPEKSISLEKKFATFSDHWAPRLIAQMNDLHIKIAKIKGEFVWHKHDETDELFFVNKGRLRMRYRDRDVLIGQGELHVVPKGTEHLPVAEEECEIMMIETAGTLNTGDAEYSDKTRQDLPWI